MASYIGIVPVIILTLYSYIKFAYRKPLLSWILGALIPGLTVGIWYIIYTFANERYASIISLTLLILFSFELFMVRNRKMSFLFHSIFFLAVFLTVGSAMRYSKGFAIEEYILLLIYFLTELNQRYLKKTYEESVMEYQNNLLKKQVNEVQNMYMTMRGWRHDYHNHLQTLKALLKLNQVGEAREYLDGLENDLDNIKQVIESGNVNVDAILNSKLSLALKENIKVNYKVEVPQKLTVTDIDLCVLIGNLIDNAVEACQKMNEEEGDKFIRLYIGILKKQLYISVTNATNEVIRKLDEDYITTKRGNHGHGLKRINNIVLKYDGYINRKNEPGVFVTEIMLPL